MLLFLFNIAVDPCLPDLRNTFKALQNPTLPLSYKFAHCLSQLKSLTLDSLIKSSPTCVINKDGLFVVGFMKKGSIGVWNFYATNLIGGIPSSSKTYVKL